VNRLLSNLTKQRQTQQRPLAALAAQRLVKSVLDTGAGKACEGGLWPKLDLSLVTFFGSTDAKPTAEWKLAYTQPRREGGRPKVNLAKESNKFSGAKRPPFKQNGIKRCVIC